MDTNIVRNMRARNTYTHTNTEIMYVTGECRVVLSFHFYVFYFTFMFLGGEGSLDKDGIGVKRHPSVNI